VFPLVSFASQKISGRSMRPREMQQFDWMILTSAQAVRAVVSAAKELKLNLILAASKLQLAVSVQ